jgi:hypothetical protein
MPPAQERREEEDQEKPRGARETPGPPPGRGAAVAASRFVTQIGSDHRQDERHDARQAWKKVARGLFPRRGPSRRASRSGQTLARSASGTASAAAANLRAVVRRGGSRPDDAEEEEHRSVVDPLHAGTTVEAHRGWTGSSGAGDRKADGEEELDEDRRKLPQGTAMKPSMVSRRRKTAAATVRGQIQRCEGFCGIDILLLAQLFDLLLERGPCQVSRLNRGRVRVSQAGGIRPHGTFPVAGLLIGLRQDEQQLGPFSVITAPSGGAQCIPAPFPS